MNQSFENFATDTRVALEQKVPFTGSVNQWLKKVVTALDGEIRTSDSLIKMVVYNRSPLKFAIYLPSITSELRDNFIIAREIGHLFCHVLPSDVVLNLPITFPRLDKDVEIEADYFAGAFLMPAPKFEEEYLTDGVDDFDMAAKFSVSVSAVLMRKSHLNLDDISP